MLYDACQSARQPPIMPLAVRASVPPCDTWFHRPTPLSIPNGISIGSAVFTQLTAESLHLTMGSPFPPSKLPLHTGGCGPNLIHGSLGSIESKTQTASRSTQPILHGSQSWHTDGPTDWQTDHATLSGATGHIYTLQCRLTIIKINNLMFTKLPITTWFVPLALTRWQHCEVWI